MACRRRPRGAAARAAGNRVAPPPRPPSCAHAASTYCLQVSACMRWIEGAHGRGVREREARLFQGGRVGVGSQLRRRSAEGSRGTDRVNRRGGAIGEESGRVTKEGHCRWAEMGALQNCVSLPELLLLRVGAGLLRLVIGLELVGAGLA